MSFILCRAVSPLSGSAHLLLLLLTEILGTLKVFWGLNILWSKVPTESQQKSNFGSPLLLDIAVYLALSNLV